MSGAALANRSKGTQAASGQPGGRQAARERVAALRARQRRAEWRRNLLLAGVIAAVVLVVAGAVTWYTTSRGGSHEAVPSALSGAPRTQPAALAVPDTSGISGVAAYDTAGYPAASKNGPASRALGHTHVTGPVTYSVSPPVGGDHNPVWLTCGVYDKPVPSEYAAHDLEHGAIWITYRPGLPRAEISQLKSLAGRQRTLSPGGVPSSRYIDLTPYPGLSAPVVASSWGFQLRLTSPTDPRLQQFIDKFRVSPRYTPEYGAPCTGGIGTPAAT